MTDLFTRFVDTGRALGGDATAFARNTLIGAGIPPKLLSLAVLCVVTMVMFYFIRGVRGLFGIACFLLTVALLLHIFKPFGWL